jgi:ABC-type transporter Mla subunit MlaD
LLSKEGRIGLVVCTISVVMLGLAPTQRKRSPILGSQYKLVFHACQGLRPSDPVVVGGVPAGRVVNIDFAPQSEWKKLNPPGDERPVVLVTVALEQGFTLSQGTGYKVVSTLRGNHFINLLIPPPPVQALSAGAVLNEELQSESDDSLKVTIRGFKDLAQRTKDMRAQFADPEFRRDVKDLASNLRFYSSEFVRVSQDSHNQVEKIHQQLNQQEQKLLSQVDQMDRQTARVGGYLRTFVPAFKAQLVGYRRRLDSSQQELDQAYRSASRYSQKMKDFTAQLEQGPIGKLNHEKISQSVHDAKNKIEFYGDLTGDMHMVTSDKQIQQDFKAIPKKWKDRTQQWKDQVRDFEHRVDSWQWLIPAPHEEPLEGPTPGLAK